MGLGDFRGLSGRNKALQWVSGVPRGFTDFQVSFRSDVLNLKGFCMLTDKIVRFQRRFKALVSIASLRV